MPVSHAPLLPVSSECESHLGGEKGVVEGGEETFRMHSTNLTHFKHSKHYIIEGKVSEAHSSFKEPEI